MKKRFFMGMITVFVLLCGAGCAGRKPEVIWESTAKQPGATDASEEARQADGAAAEEIQQPDGTAAEEARQADGSAGAEEAWQADGNAGAESAAGGEPAVDGAFGVSGMAAETEGITETPAIFVDICGAVQRPGVYELAAGARVCDAVAAAGGLLENADLASLNQAAFLQDAAKIYVYTQEEAAAQGIAAPEPVQNAAGGQEQAPGQQMESAAGQETKVNINTADIAQLCTLTGIGEARARDIIAYREANGGFQSAEEIMNVSGIKEATFQKIKDEIAVR
ncbi:helix-hairpin-helix domain-containing protein [Marvinbryantia formatexigens]|uniref:helix-hairpin-helix domain-containing protein n=1 Tax=Marvinbryantia formatexigens TaxID=168384 RepID=UPI000309BCB3|nr:helix-hairpin-helix domain-containing protein [Marvinbryantia formatexigens]UWO24242.1 helix-hairpin-helix domain-containing protein [Marvinbryantia formatexigens DSM 14469]SDF58032.1 competence protein ComEA [Marvinbryantia formatexigens]